MAAAASSTVSSGADVSASGAPQPSAMASAGAWREKQLGSPSMHVSARLDETTVRTLLAQLLPVTIVLDDDDSENRWIRIDPARRVDFAANEGLRLEVAGQLRWKTAGVPVLLTIHSAQLLITPAVVDDADGARLVFRPSLEKMI